jgi:tRNA pseudouridine synthase 10
MDPVREGEDAARSVVDAALRAAEGWEFRTFLCGASPPPGIPEPAAAEYRRAVNRTLGTALAVAWGGKRTVEFRRPDARFVVRLPSGAVELVLAPLFVYGRYRKHSRNLAQTPYHCRSCRGSGCANCSGSGRHLPGSVSEFLVPLLVEAAGAESATFSGCGREDADVRMLGRGRPFVVPLARPRRRALDWAGIRARAEAAAAGAAAFPVLHAVASLDGERVPAHHPPKRYLARVEIEGGAREGDAARLVEALSGTLVRQRTPVRVSHRRADKVRERRVLGATARALGDGDLELELRTEGGTYVKEIVSGDEGRSEPSAASILGRACVCTALDVLDVEGEDPPPI